MELTFRHLNHHANFFAGDRQTGRCLLVTQAGNHTKIGRLQKYDK